MGVCHPGPKPERHSEITKQLQKEKRESRHKLSILFLGAGQSGKSTFFKQTKAAHNIISKSERYVYIEIVRDSIVEALIQLCDTATSDSLDLSSKAQEAKDKLCDIETWSADVARLCSIVWNDDSVQAVHKAGSNLSILWCIDAFMKDIDRIADEDYEPSDNDMICSRVKTTGIKEIAIEVDNSTVTFTDVGGQRSERRKWIHCFNGVNAVLYLCAIDEYDKYEGEDNCLVQSIKLFEQVVNEQALQGSLIILFLNKADLFKRKFDHVNLQDHFEGYKEGQDDWVNGVKYIEKKFKRKCRGRAVQTYVTCAVDGNNCKKVFNSVIKDVRRQSLIKSGLIPEGTTAVVERNKDRRKNSI